MFPCHYCGVVKYSIEKFLQHLALFHGHQPNFSVTCHLCRRPYNKVDSLKKHYYRKHTEAKLDDEHNKETYIQDMQDNVMDSSCRPVIDDASDESLQMALKNLQNNLSLFVLKLQEKHLLPKCLQETLVHDIKSIIEEYQSMFSRVCTAYMTQESMDIVDNSDLHHVLYSSDVVDKLFENCSTAHKLEKYCKEYLNAIFPTACILSNPVNGRPASFQYISILSTLKQVLQKGEIFNLIFSEKSTTTDGLYIDFTTGSEFQSHPIFSSHRICLRLHLYIDEFEIVNPLGSKKGKHKICAIYFTLGNLGPKICSKLKHIYLITLCRNVIVHDRYDDLLKPIINDLHILAREGVQVQINGSPMQIVGALATVSADNLGAHQLGGFTRSFSCGRVCRFCMILHQELAVKLCEEKCYLRNKTAHAYHVQAVVDNPEMAKSTYGVVSKCPFENLGYFSTIDSFVPDLMHDFLEGIVPVLLRLILTIYHTDGIVSIRAFNSKLSNFNFGANDSKSKPVAIPQKCISHGAAIPGKAIEKWCLFRFLPFLVLEDIPHNDKYWELYLQCRHISDILFAPSLKVEDVDELETIIPAFLTEFVNLFPGKITPKFHYLVHYPTQIRKLGPLRHLWCMRFEGKHQYFKRIAHQLYNYRNCPYSLSKRHQLRLSWEMTSDDYLNQSPKAEHCKSVNFSRLTDSMKRSIYHYANFAPNDSIECDENVLICSTLTFNNNKYAVGDCFIIELVEFEEIPVFIKISKIVNFRSKWLLYGQLYQSHSFDHLKHAYQVKEMEIWTTIIPGVEIDYHALDMYSHADKFYIVLHHKPCKLDVQ